MIDFGASDGQSVVSVGFQTAFQKKLNIAPRRSMTTLDRYLVRQFLINFAILLLVFIALFMVVDLIVDLDEFLAAGRERADRFGGVVLGVLWTIADYYGPVVLLLYVFFSGLLVVAAMGFTFSALSRTRELTAMVTSGISMYRISAPVVIVGCLLNALTLPNQELIIPKLANKLARSKSQVRHHAIGGFDIQYAPDDHRNLFSATKFESTGDQAMLTGVTILVRDDSGRALSRITAEQAFWDEHRHGWELVGGLTISPTPDARSIDGGGQLQPDPIEFFATSLSPQTLLARQAKIYPMLLSLNQLRQLAEADRQQAGSMYRIMHSRLSLLVLNGLVLIMGLPFFLTREPVNLLVQGIKASIVCLGTWSVGLILVQTGIPNLNPVASAWLPVVIFLPVAGVLLQMVKT